MSRRVDGARWAADSSLKFRVNGVFVNEKMTVSLTGLRFEECWRPWENQVEGMGQQARLQWAQAAWTLVCQEDVENSSRWTSAEASFRWTLTEASFRWTSCETSEIGSTRGVFRCNVHNVHQGAE